MADDQESHYIHGTTPVEQGRLTTLNDLINRATLAELRPRTGERVLDVGCGLAQFTRAVGRITGPSGRVLGVERDSAQLAEALRQARHAGEDNLVELRQGDALALPLRDDEWGTFDTAHARFVLEHVRDPLAVVRQMVRAVRPGGRVALADDDHDVLRMWPDPPCGRAAWDAYVRTYDRFGNDAFVGRRLVALLHEAGAAPRRNAWVFFGGCAGQDAFGSLVSNLVGILRGARDSIVREGLLDADTFDQGIASIEKWGQRPDAALWYAISWAEGVRPA